MHRKSISNFCALQHFPSSCFFGEAKLFCSYFSAVFFCQHFPLSHSEYLRCVSKYLSPLLIWDTKLKTGRGAEKNVGIGGRDGCSTRDKKQQQQTQNKSKAQQSTNKLCVESWWDEKYNKNAKNKSRSERHSRNSDTSAARKRISGESAALLECRETENCNYCIVKRPLT